MKAQYLGHVVFYVKDLQRSLAFYRDLLGFQEVGRIFNGAAAALTSGRTHHELLLIQVGDAPGPPSGRRRGLYHIGIKVGDSLDELRAAKQELEAAGVPIDGMSDHTVSQSLYLKDPDGNEVEVYVDAAEAIWKNDPPLRDGLLPRPLSDGRPLPTSCLSCRQRTAWVPKFPKNQANCTILDPGPRPPRDGGDTHLRGDSGVRWPHDRTESSIGTRLDGGT